MPVPALRAWHNRRSCFPKAPMSRHELRNPDEARTYLLQSLWLARVVTPDVSTVEAVLRWALEITSEGAPLPPLGFVSDVGYAALGNIRDFDHSSHDAAGEFDPSLLRKYEDYVIGKLYADMTFERGSDALLRYQGRDRERCLAYLINQLRRRAGVGGAILSPAVIKSLLSQKSDSIMAAAWDAAEETVSRLLIDRVAELTEKVRNVGELLGSEDIFELEHGTALHGFGQRLALRQILQAADLLCESLPHQKPPHGSRRHAVATRIVDEDTYPVGGFSSISHKGSIESLLHSQLAFIEPDDRPDLFDVKFLRDELLFYSRDENQFLRQRRSFVFALYPDLAKSRVKDGGLPWQRIVLLLAVVYAAVNRLIEWLSDEALSFDLLFIQETEERKLDDEKMLLETLFREQIDNGTVTIAEATPSELRDHCQKCSQRSLTHGITVGARDRLVDVDGILQTRVCMRSSLLEHGLDDGELSPPDEPGIAGWQQSLARLLAAWI